MQRRRAGPRRGRARAGDGEFQAARRAPCRVAGQPPDEGALAVFQVLGGNGHERLGVEEANKIGRRSHYFTIDLGVDVLVLELDHGFLALVFADAFKRHAAEVEAVARLTQHVGDFAFKEAEGPTFAEEELLRIVGVGRGTNDAAELLRVIDRANDDARLHLLAAHGRCERGHL